MNRTTFIVEDEALAVKKLTRLIEEVAPEFEILGLFVLLLIGFVLVLEGGHESHLTANGETFPYIPQWIVIFILLLMFSVDLYQNWLDKQLEKEQDEPVHLHRRNK